MKSEASVYLDFLEGNMLGTRKLEINDIINTVDTFIHPFAKKKKFVLTAPILFVSFYCPPTWLHLY